MSLVNEKNNKAERENPNRFVLVYALAINLSNV